MLIQLLMSFSSQEPDGNPIQSEPPALQLSSIMGCLRTLVRFCSGLPSHIQLRVHVALQACNTLSCCSPSPCLCPVLHASVAVKPCLPNQPHIGSVSIWQPRGSKSGQCQAELCLDSTCSSRQGQRKGNSSSLYCGVTGESNEIEYEKQSHPHQARGEPND